MSDQPAFIQSQISLARYSSWQVGGLAEYFSEPTSEDELRACIVWAVKQSLLISVIGGGTNILIADSGIQGLTLCLRKLGGHSQRSDGVRFYLECASGMAKSDLLKIFLQRQLAPALFLAGIPGDVGGGVIMNAGVSEAIEPREFVEIVDWFEVMRFSKMAPVERIIVDRSKWRYRHCEDWGKGVITKVGLSWIDKPDLSILEKVKLANRNRLQKQPLHLPSCGSVFVNPSGHKSGQLIESCGLKGFRVGGAQISEKHANFIVNCGGATAMDMHEIMQRVRAKVFAETGIQLQAEVVYMGDWRET